MKNLYAKTQGDLSGAMQVSINTVKNWAKDPDFPKKTKRGYSIAKVVEWRRARAERNPTAKKPKTAQAQNIDEAKLRKEILNCEKLQIEIDKLNRQLISIEDHTRDVALVASIMPQAFEQMISKATAEQQSAEVIGYLEGARDWTLNMARESIEANA